MMEIMSRGMYGGLRRKNNEPINGQMLKRGESPSSSRPLIEKLKDAENLQDSGLWVMVLK
jgi:hypothetical protein